MALDYADRVIGIKAGKIIYDGPANEIDKETLAKIYGRDLISEEVIHNFSDSHIILTYC